MARTLYYQWERRVSDYGSNPATPGCIESVSEVAYALLNHYSTRLFACRRFGVRLRADKLQRAAII